jgi:hypothetical protein
MGSNTDAISSKRGSEHAVAVWCPSPYSLPRDAGTLSGGAAINHDFANFEHDRDFGRSGADADLLD